MNTTTVDVIVYCFAYIGLMATCFAIGWFTYDPIAWMGKRIKGRGKP